MSDLDLMMQKYPTISRDPDVSCGICEPNAIQNAATTLRYDTAVINATIAAGPPQVATFAAVTRDFFVAGKGEALGGLATATKDLSHTNLDAGGSAAESPCIFTAYGLWVEFLPLVILDATGNMSLLPSYYYDQAYNRSVIDRVANSLALRIVEANGCTLDVGVSSLWPSDGSSREVGDRNRSGMIGSTRTLRVTICFPGQNAKRPRFTMTLVNSIAVTENGGNVFGTIPGGSILALPIRIVTEGVNEAPPG